MARVKVCVVVVVVVVQVKDEASRRQELESEGPQSR